MSLVGFSPASAATFPCSIGPSDIATLHLQNAGDGSYQSIGLIVTAISATSGNCAALPSTTSIRPLYMGMVGAPGVPLSPATAQGGGLERVGAGEVAYKPPSTSFSGTDTFTIDNNNTSRVINVTVIVDSGSGSVPTITSVSPSSGSTSGGASVTITGTNFTGATSVNFGGSSAPSFTVNSATSITATGPAGTGTVDITVTTSGGTSATGSADHFTYVSPPTVAPKSASAAYQTATPIDLGSSITGSHTSIAIGSAAAHGTTSISGDVVTYTPANGYAGSDSFTYTATGSGGTSSPATVSITVGSPTVSMSPSAGALPGATMGSAYSQTISASGGTAPYIFTITAGALPAGLTLSSTGALSGTPTASGTYNFTVTATDAFSFTASTAYSLTVAVAAPVAGSASATMAANSSANPITLNLTGGAATSVAVASGASHGTATASGTSITYTPTAGYSGSDSFTYTATNTTGTSAPATVTVTVSAPTITLSPTTLPGATEGSAYSQTVSASAGTAPYSFAVTAGALPSGMSLSSAGTLSGTPTANGTFNFTVTATDANSATGSRAYNLSVAVQAPIAGSVSTTLAANSSANPITLNLTGGAATSVAVASGASHGTATASGTSITYTPTAGYSGSDSFTYTATNSSGTSAPAAVNIIVGAPALTLSPSTLSSGTEGSAYSQTITTSGGTAPYSYAVAAGALPSGMSLSSAGTLSGTPTANGTFNFTVGTTDSNSATGSRSYSLSIAVQAPIAGSVSVTVAANSSANPITLNLSGGTATSVAVASGASHGTATASGTSITYTPTTGYSGSDSFTYTATNSSGTSAPATVTITVSAPTITLSPTTLPGATESSAYSQTLSASAGTAPYSYAISSGALPAGLTLNSAGELSGTPTAAGSFGFTVTATDAHGATGSASYTLVVSVQAPTAGNVSATIPADSSANAITLNLSGGAASSVAVASAANHGTATASGTSITYTPTAGYSGTDSFTYTARNGSGTSASATISITVTPPAPVVHDTTVTATTSTVQAGNTAVIDLSALITGQVDDIRVTTMPTHGTVTINAPSASPSGIISPRSIGRFRASYIPHAGYIGADSFAFTASGAGGTSAEATVTIQVVGAPPAAPSLSGSTTDGKTISFDVTGGASGGPFTDADIVSITPSEAATATVVASGAAAARSYRLDVTPKARFDGRIVVTYRLANGAGFSAPATVTVNVTARPDPSADPVVRGISDAQAETARRFSQTQLDNFMQRTEMLHGTGGRRSVMGIRLASRDSSGIGDDNSRPDQLGAAANESSSKDSDKAHANAAANPSHDPGAVAFWTAGTIQIGARDQTTQRAKLSATTTGLSGGIDLRISSRLALGIGAGYGKDHTDVGGGAGGISAESKLIAVYASASPASAWFIDAVAGHGRLDFDSDRTVATAGAIARGSRSGNFTMGSLSSGIDQQRGQWRWSAYARGDYLNAMLNAYREYGAGIFDLRFDHREVRSLKGVLGFRMAITRPTQFGAITGRLRGEWQHEFQGVAAQGLDYADIIEPSFYTIGSQGWSREQFVASPGVTIDLPADWKLDLELGWQIASGERDARSRIHISKQF